MSEHARRRKASHEPLEGDKRDAERFRWRPRELSALGKATLKEFVEDKAPKQAAALAYYTLFALGPLLVLAISIAGLVFGADAARGAIMTQLDRFLGAAGADGIGSLLEGANRSGAGIIGTIVGLVVLVFSAGAVFAQLKEALNRIWEVEAKKAVGWKAKLHKAVRKNFLSFTGIIGTGFLLLVSLVASAAIAAMGDYASSLFPGAELLLQILNFVVSLAMVSFVFALTFKFLPDARIAWRDVGAGAVLTGILFLVGQFALGYYLGAGPLATRYGAAGAVLVILVWVYYSSMIVFFGAEFTQVFANTYGSHVRESGDARPLTRAIQEEQDEPEHEGIAREGSRRGRGTT